MALQWKNRKLVCGLFTFRIEPTNKRGKYRRWSWFELNLTWSDNVEYTTEAEAKAACEKWLITEVKKMNREIKDTDKPKEYCVDCQPGSPCFKHISWNGAKS